MDCAYFRRFARYNAWANRQLYDACAALDVDEFHRPRPAFFGSISRTLNHILAGDRVWLSRFERTALDVTSLDQVLHAEFAALRRAREAEDARITAYAAGLNDGVLDGVLEYHSMTGGKTRAPLRWAIAHFFNHQTHHRGQAHCLLSATPVGPPPLDLIYFLREDQAAG